MTDTATPTAAVDVAPTAPVTPAPVAPEPTKEPKQTTADAKPAEPVKARSLLDEPTKAAEPTKPAEPTPEETKATDKAPEKYEPFKLADGVALTDELSSTFSELAKAANLPQAKAQEWLDKMASGLEAQNQASLDQWINRAAEETRAAEGDQFEAGRAQVARAINHYGDEQFAALLKTPLGMLMVNNKAMWGFLKKLGADVSDDSVVTGAPRGAPTELGASGFYKAIGPKQ